MSLPYSENDILRDPPSIDNPITYHGAGGFSTLGKFFCLLFGRHFRQHCLHYSACAPVSFSSQAGQAKRLICRNIISHIGYSDLNPHTQRNLLDPFPCSFLRAGYPPARTCGGHTKLELFIPDLVLGGGAFTSCFMKFILSNTLPCV